MRMILEQSQKEYITLGEELSTTNLYIELESERFENKFRWEINTNGIELSEFMVPPLILQPFIENSLWHGLMPLKTEGKMVISFKENNNNLVVEISDNGIGREKAQQIAKKRKGRESHGIRITEERLSAVNSLYNRDSLLKYTDLKDENENALGTVVEFTLPVIKSDI